MQGQQAEVGWNEGVPVSARFDDPYFSMADGAAETAHVFLAGNGLPGRFADGFSIAELGFGTGLNFLVTLAAWKAFGTPGGFSYASFEAYPMAPADLSQAHAAFPALATEAVALCSAMAAGPAPWHIGPAFLTVIEGDAREVLPRWGGRADAWFLDGFSPAKNPELWEPALLAQVARHTSPGGTFATYTAAGHVRRALAEAGFTVERQPGFGRKRHMSVGHL